MKQIKIITNNPSVIDEYQKQQVIKADNMREVLQMARDLIHLGHELLTHPMSGSIKPNETPYKSLIVSAQADQLNFESLSHIEGAIRKYEQFQKDRPTPDYPESILKDFQLVDFTLLKSGYDSIAE